MKLYELPARPDKPIEIHGLTDGDNKPVVVLYHHLDGAYSFCTLETEDGPVVHLSAGTPLKEINGVYVISEEQDGSH